MGKKVPKDPTYEREMERRALFPGQTLDLQVDEGVTLPIEISPVGFRHIKRYGAFIATALASLSRLDKDADQDVTIAHLVPVILTNGLGLLEDCVKVRGHKIGLEDLPHEYLPPIVETWLLESFFGERKWKPWVTMVENLMTHYTGENPKILEKLSAYFSRPATNAPTSSTIDNQD